jgi:gamma-glutamyltranspeptidase/glutathione hydrolase
MLSYQHTLYLVFLLLIGITACKPTAEPKALMTIEKQAFGDSAMVVSAHPLATQAGVDILKEGGNAIDAMVTVQLALAVAYPRAGNIGGGGFLVYRAADGKVHTLDFREQAPQAADKDMYLDEQGNVIDSLSLFGHLASGVPGAIAGIYEAHQKFGKLPWKRLVQPAIELAENGLLLTEREAEGLNEFRPLFEKANANKNAFTPDKVWKVGDNLRQPDLANTLKRIAEQGRAGFYQGKTADLIVEDMKQHGGIISHEDLKNYKAIWRDPVKIPYKEYTIWSMAPPSSGGICLAELLNMVEPYPLHEWGYGDPRSIHVITEAARRAYADRAEHLGDADFYPVPIASLTSQAYADERMQDFRDSIATPSDSISHGTPYPKESDQTTHYCIVDAEGNVVSVTTTINSNFGSKVVIDQAGFFMNSEMDDFSAKPGVPNQFGLLGNEANAIAPNKRMLSSMTPSIVEKEGQFLLAVGSPGGSKIITTVFQVITNVIDFDLSLEAAVQNPRFHFQWYPDTLYYEQDAFSPQQLEQLQNLGHHPKKRADIGQVEAVLQLPDGRLEGVADRRGDNHAGGL